MDSKGLTLYKIYFKYAVCKMSFAISKMQKL